MLRAILTLRCPRCRRGKLFKGLIGMPERCPECGMIYEREHGYFVGAMAISYGLAVGLVAIPVYLLLATADFAARDDPAQRAVINTNRQKAIAELDRLKLAVLNGKKALADLQEEARRAGVPAGWLR